MNEILNINMKINITDKNQSKQNLTVWSLYLPVCDSLRFFCNYFTLRGSSNQLNDESRNIIKCNIGIYSVLDCFDGHWHGKIDR